MAPGLAASSYPSPSPDLPDSNFVASDASWRERATRLLAETQRLVSSPIGAIKAAEEDKRRLSRLHKELAGMVAKDLRLTAELQAGNFGKVRYGPQGVLWAVSKTI